MQIYARGGSPTEQKGSSLFVKKKKDKKKKDKPKQKQRNIMDIDCAVLLQEFNKYPLFIYNNAMDQLVTVWRPLLPNVKNSSSFSIPNIFSNTCHNAAKLEKRKVKVPGHNYFWVGVYPFFKECCFTVRVRVRVSVNPNPNLACEQALRGGSGNECKCKNTLKNTWKMELTSLLMSSPPISISHRLFRYSRYWRYSSFRDVVASSPSLSRSAARAPRRVACPQANPNPKTAFFRKKIDLDPAFYWHPVGFLLWS